MSKAAELAFVLFLLIMVGSAMSINQSEIDWRKLNVLLKMERDWCAATRRDHRGRSPCRNLPLPSVTRYPLKSYFDSIYTIELYIGTPARAFSVSFDTGSNVTWLTGPECDASCEIDPKLHHTRRIFQYNDSRSFETTFLPMNHTYGSATVAGFLGYDDIGFADFGLSHHPVMIARQMTSMNGSVLDGLAGLNYPREKDQATPPLSLLEAIKKLPSPSYNFTLFLRRNTASNETEDAGRVTWGEKDPEHCHDMFYVPLVNVNNVTSNPFGLWEIVVADVTFDGQRRGRRGLKEPGPFLAVVDSGSEALILPPEQYGDYTSLVGAVTRGGHPSVPCNASLPPLRFEIGDHILEVEATQFVVMTDNTDIQPYCGLTLAPSDIRSKEPEVFLGLPFLRQFCSFWDFNRARVGFAPTKHV